ncbi:ThiF family adenylyltransferase [Noviherbaspirillum sp.]|uniref:ThiF family adenylyltransferase n=1 Tax=Noviherbaspirillum sp. TaxID=1926288 RepID=UPI002FE37B59
MIQIVKSVAITDRVRVRPSVSWVERPNEVVDFFFGNTRNQKTVRVIPKLVTALRQMNGKTSLREIAENIGIPPKQLLDWTSQLIEWSAAERMSVADWIETSDLRRSLHMLADFIPDYSLVEVWEKIRATQFVILGCGAVGSWVADGIARMGGQHFLLIDPDKVAPSNLNRSLFLDADVGSYKTTSLANRLRQIDADSTIATRQENIASVDDLNRLIPSNQAQVVISCIDSPSVDVAAGYANQFCIENEIPLVVAGGYNLHLSLIGITVLPRKTACFQCSLIFLSKLQKDTRIKVKKLPRPYRNIGNVAPLAAMTASIASMEAIRVAANDKHLLPTMLNRRGEFNINSEGFSWVEISKQIDCPVCST